MAGRVQARRIFAARGGKWLDPLCVHEGAEMRLWCIGGDECVRWILRVGSCVGNGQRVVEVEKDGCGDMREHGIFVLDMERYVHH